MQGDGDDLEEHMIDHDGYSLIQRVLHLHLAPLANQPTTPDIELVRNAYSFLQ